jgi:hypothetical protein
LRDQHLEAGSSLRGNPFIGFIVDDGEQPIDAAGMSSTS